MPKFRRWEDKGNRFWIMQQLESKAGENFKGVTHRVRSWAERTPLASGCSDAESSGHPGWWFREPTGTCPIERLGKPWDRERCRERMGHWHIKGDFVGYQRKEQSLVRERRKMLEREQIIMKSKPSVGSSGSRGGKDWFSFHTSKKYCFCLDLPLKNQHL